MQTFVYVVHFLKHDEVRRKEYLAELAKPASERSVVMHAQDLTPCEIWHKYCGNKYYGNVTVNDSLERMWENLKQIDCTVDTMCIVDGSGSMTTLLELVVSVLFLLLALWVFTLQSTIREK